MLYTNISMRRQPNSDGFPTVQFFQQPDVLDTRANNCLQAMMSTINPFVDVTKPVRIDTPVVWMSMRQCDAGFKRRRRRRSSTALGLTDGFSSVLEVNIPPTTLGLWVNETSKDGVVISQFNLTSPGRLPLVIRVTPNEPSRINILRELKCPKLEANACFRSPHFSSQCDVELRR